jgi:hypothetical protein
VWTCVAAQHRGRGRAELLTLAAVAYYCGEGMVRAGLALGHAVTASDDDNSTMPRLTEIIYSALEAGLPLERIRSAIPNRDTAPIPGTKL